MNEDLFGGLGVKVNLKHEQDFLKIIETLTRIGIEAKWKQKLIQSCHILHKRGTYAILHFKELFILDGKPSNVTEMDIYRRNTIVKLLDQWGLVELENKDEFYTNSNFAPMSQIKVIPHSKKREWTLESKYTIGTKT